MQSSIFLGDGIPPATGRCSFFGAAARKRQHDLTRTSQPLTRSRSPPISRSTRRASPRRGSAKWLDNDDDVPPFHDRQPRPPPMPPPNRAAYVRGPAASLQTSRPSAPFGEPRSSEASPVQVLPIALPRSAALIQDGYPARSRALVYHASLGHMLPSAQDMLETLVGDLNLADIAVDHDTDLNVFPEIGKELKKFHIGDAFCVATCASHSRWAVGVGSRNAENLEGLALLALCTVMLDLFDRDPLFSDYPDFKDLCIQTGLVSGRSIASRRSSQVSPPPIVFSAFTQQAPLQAQASSKQQKQSTADLPALRWISPRGLPDRLEGFSESAPVVGDSTDLRCLIGSARGMLSEMVGGNVDTEVEIIDDNDWNVFPTVGEALKIGGFPEYGSCIAISKQHLKWAVGLGGQWKRRANAARLSLCVAIVQDIAQSSSLLCRYPDLREFCEGNDGGCRSGYQDDYDIYSGPPVGTRKTKVARISAPVEASSSETYQARLVWITLPDDAALVIDGYPAICAALVYDGTIGHMLPEAQNILTELVGDFESADIAVDHDTDWVIFPEVAKELDKAGAGKAFCVATCAGHSRVAVGVGGKKPQHRENCAMLALCMTMLDIFGHESVFSKWPDFRKLCMQLGVASGRHIAPVTRAPRAPVAFTAFAQQPPPPRKTPVVLPTFAQQAAPAKSSNQGQKGKYQTSVEGMPALRWIALDEMPEELDQFPENAPVVGESADLRWLTGRGHEMLSDMVGSVSTDVKIIDDNHWKLFPLVGEALKEAGFAEYSFCIAKSERHSKWAVGVGGQWKRRENAAKLSLCLAIIRDSEQSSTWLSKYPDLKTFWESNEDIDGLFDDLEVAGSHAESFATLRRDVPFWIQWPEGMEMPVELAGLASFALALSTDGTKRKGLYSKADEVLRRVLGDEAKNVEYHDNIDHSTLNCVDAHESVCVASLPDRLIWAAGISSKSNSRLSAAKVVLASAVLLQLIEGEPEPESRPDLDNFQAFAEFFEVVRNLAPPL